MFVFIFSCSLCVFIVISLFLYCIFGHNLFDHWIGRLLFRKKDLDWLNAICRSRGIFHFLYKNTHTPSEFWHELLSLFDSATEFRIFDALRIYQLNNCFFPRSIFGFFLICFSRKWIYCKCLVICSVCLCLNAIRFRIIAFEFQLKYISIDSSLEVIVCTFIYIFI